jgi:hypothetical protein
MSKETSRQTSLTSAFTDALHEGIERIKSVIDDNPFTFMINKEKFNIDLFEPVFLPPALDECLMMDRSNRMFVSEDDNITSEMISILVHKNESC